MKKLIIMMCFAVTALHAIAQTDDESKGGFKKENLFTGGSVALGFGNGSSSFGLSPYLGYSINKYVDVAASFGYSYVSQKQYDFYGYYYGKARQNVLSPGAFVRIFPVKFLYAQAQYEQNFITTKFLPAANTGYVAQKYKTDGPSLLVGAGLATGRGPGSLSYGYISILFDVAKNKNSPYTDGYGNVTPVFRAGYNIALFQGRDGGGGGGRRRSSRTY